jgi:hypothetical protein
MKVAHLAITKSGSNILRNEMGWAGRARIRVKTHDVQFASLKKMLRTPPGDVMGHLSYSDEARDLLRDHFIIFQFRDPRAVIVSRYAFSLRLYGPTDFEKFMRRTIKHMIAMEPWYEHCGLAVRYEHLIEKKYPPTHTYREKNGTWMDEFPSDMLDLYYELSDQIRYWECALP